MSIFDKDLIENEESYKHQISVEEDVALCIGLGACLVETKDIKAFLGIIQEKCNVNYTVLGSGLLADRLKTQQGRPFEIWDVTSFCKNDAIGSMYRLSQRKDKPIVIIENITEIPIGDPAIYDDPVYVENILLHSWKNDIIQLTHPQYGQFQMNSRDYSIIIPVMPGDVEKPHFSIKGEIGYVQF